MLSTSHRLKLRSRRLVRSRFARLLQINSINAERKRGRLLRHPLVTAAALTRATTKIARRIVMLLLARRLAIADIALVQIITLAHIVTELVR